MQLGLLLGAESYKPEQSGRTDAAWVWSDQLWIAVEAKSEEHPDARVSLTDVRQAGDQLITLAHDRRTEPPEGSVVVLVSPRELVDPTAVVVAPEFLYLTSPATILGLAEDALAAWATFRSQAPGMSEAERRSLVTKLFERHSVTPAAVLHRLTRAPIKA